MNDPPDNDLNVVRGESTRHTRDGEQRHARNEDPLVAVLVAKSTGRNQRDAERQRIARDNPTQRRLTRVQALPNARQRHIDDRGIQKCNEHAGEQNNESKPRFAGNSFVSHGCFLFKEWAVPVSVTKVLPPKFPNV